MQRQHVSQFQALLKEKRCVSTIRQNSKVDNWKDIKVRNSQIPALMFHDCKLSVSDNDIHAKIAE